MTKTIRSLVVLAAVVSMAGALGFAQSGDATYKSKCAMCHGPAGTPNPTMAKMMGIKAASEYKADSVAVMTAAVKNGKGKMKPIAGLSDAQISGVVTYFRTLK